MSILNFKYETHSKTHPAKPTTFRHPQRKSKTLLHNTSNRVSLHKVLVFALPGEHVDLAKKYKALIFGVEHRYYGKSINKDGLALENMKFLSSQQAYVT